RLISLFHAPPTTQIYPLSLHDALPISEPPEKPRGTRLRLGTPPPRSIGCRRSATPSGARPAPTNPLEGESRSGEDASLERRKRSDRKSTRLNSSHLGISYAVFCLKKKK